MVIYYRGAYGTFGDNRSVLYLDLGGDYTSINRQKESKVCI